MRMSVRKVKLGRAGHDRSPAKKLRQSMQLRIMTWHEQGVVGKWFLGRVPFSAVTYVGAPEECCLIGGCWRGAECLQLGIVAGKKNTASDSASSLPPNSVSGCCQSFLDCGHGQPTLALQKLGAINGNL